jgi:hypothetical protein
MHKIALIGLFALAAGCSTMSAEKAKNATPADPPHPAVVIQGIDGTTMAGELLNGSVTIDSGQGELTLLTDHVHTITMSSDLDKLDSDSMKVSGKVKDTKFYLKNEHGVFTLSKDRLRKIDFVNNPPLPATLAGNGAATAVHASSGSTTPASAR